MRPTNSNTTAYQPGIPPADPAALQGFLRSELTKIAATLSTLAAGHLDVTYMAPAKPRQGDIRYADGTQWQPNGSGGAGIWYFNGTAWIQLG